MTILNKKVLREYQELVKNDEYSKEANDKMFHHLIFNPLIRFLVLFVILLFSIINHTKISKLARITSDSILNHELILGPKVYFTILILTCFFLILFSFILYFIREKNANDYQDHLKKLLKTYSIYDITAFILTSVTCAYFFIMFVFTPCTIDGPSMQNTFEPNDRVIVWHFAYKPAVDDVVIFDASNAAYGNYEGFFVKRIIAKPSDVVRFGGGYENDLFVNDHSIARVTYTQFTNMQYSVDNYEENDVFIVPEGRYLVLGDNRNNSTDSRRLGLIYKEDILGKVAIRFYPFSEIGKPDKDIIE